MASSTRPRSHAHAQLSKFTSGSRLGSSRPGIKVPNVNKTVNFLNSVLFSIYRCVLDSVSYLSIQFRDSFDNDKQSE